MGIHPRRARDRLRKTGHLAHLVRPLCTREGGFLRDLILDTSSTVDRFLYDLGYDQNFNSDPTYPRVSYTR